MASAVRSTIIIAGVGNGTGIGGATARLFAKSGFNIALIARSADRLELFTAELKKSGAEAAAFPVTSYSHSETTRVFQSIKSTFPSSPVRVTLWNAATGVWKPFLQVTELDLQNTVDTAVIGAFSFARESLLIFKEQELDERGSRGTLIFTGATASTRGNVTTSAFSSGKFATRALSQSLAKEFGKENIHVAHVIIDGAVITDASTARRLAANSEYVENEDIRLNPDAIAETYLHVSQQHRSAWSWELDLRPSHEKW